MKYSAASTMKRFLMGSLMVLTATLIFGGCDGATSVPSIGALTEVVVVTRAHSGESRKEIVDPVAVSKIVRFINEQGSGWKTPWYGIPIPSLELRLYDARQFKGSFGAGKTFFETQRGGAFFVKNVSPKDVTRLTVLVDEIGAQTPTSR